MATLVVKGNIRGYPVFWIVERMSSPWIAGAPSLPWKRSAADDLLRAAETGIGVLGEKRG